VFYDDTEYAQRGYGRNSAQLGVCTIEHLVAPALRCDPSTHELLPLTHGADRSQQLRSCINFGNVSVPARVQRILHHLQGIVLTQKDDLRVGRDSAYPPGSLNAADSWQADVQENQVRPKLFGFLDRLLAICGLTNDVQDGIAGQKRANSSSDNRMVVHNKNLDF